MKKKLREPTKQSPTRWIFFYVRVSILIILTKGQY